MKRLASVVVALLVFGLVGTALASGTLSGKYKTVIKGSTAFGGFLNGKWVIKFKNGTYHVTRNGKAITHGKNTFKGNVVTFKDAPGPNACAHTGKYTYRLKGKSLTFKKISDSTSGNCIGRVTVLTNGFTKVG